MDPKEKIYHLVSQDQIAQAIDELINYQRENDLEDTGLLISARWNRYEKAVTNGLIDSRDTTYAEIVASILKTVGKEVSSRPSAPKLSLNGRLIRVGKFFKKSDSILFEGICALNDVLARVRFLDALRSMSSTNALKLNNSTISVVEEGVTVVEGNMFEKISVLEKEFEKLSQQGFNGLAVMFTILQDYGLENKMVEDAVQTRDTQMEWYIRSTIEKFFKQFHK